MTVSYIIKYHGIGDKSSLLSFILPSPPSVSSLTLDPSPSMFPTFLHHFYVRELTHSASPDDMWPGSQGISFSTELTWGLSGVPYVDPFDFRSKDAKRNLWRLLLNGCKALV